MVKKILHYPDPRLKNKTRKVRQFDQSLQLLIDNLVDTMRSAGGVGLAAPQIGDPRRVAVIEHRPSPPQSNDSSDSSQPTIPLHVLVNPKITHSSKDFEVAEEGCLSIPGVTVKVNRPRAIHLIAQDSAGQPIKIRPKDFFSRVCQHEIDHLDGVLIIDRGKAKKILSKPPA